MGITLPVGTKLDDAQARRTAQQAADYFSQSGQRAGDEFSRNVNQGLGRVDTGKARVQAAALARAYDKAADAAGKLRTEEAKLEAVQASGTATNAQLITHSERAEKARRAEARAVREAAAAVRELRDAGRSSGSFMGDMSSGMENLGTAARSFAMAGLPAAVLGVAGAAVTAAGALAVLPAVLGGVGAGVGTLSIGLHGFSDTLKDMGDAKKFAEDIHKLAPSAQQAALSIQSLTNGPLGELQKATQESLFKDMGREIHDLTNTMLPTVKAATTGIAEAFNSMGRGAMDQLMRPETAAALDATLQNVTKAFQNLAPAAAPFTKAMADIMQVGSGFLPGLAQSITNAATAFSQFITHAKESGQLASWIREGGDILGQVGTLAFEAGRAFAAMLPTARTVFGYVAGALHETADLLREHPGLVWGAVGAYAGFKTITGLAAVGQALIGINAALTAMPGLAATAGTALGGLATAAAGLMKIAGVVGTIGALVNSHGDSAPGGDQTTTTILQREGATPDQIKAYQAAMARGDNAAANKIEQDLRAHSLGLPAIAAPDNRTPEQIRDQISQRRQGLPGGTAMAPAAPGWNEFLQPATAGLPQWAPIAVPDAPGGSGGGKKNALPTVPYGNKDPMSLLQGVPVTASLYSAASTVLDDQQKVAQAKSDLNTLEKANVRDENAITAKRNELAQAQRQEHEAELRLTEAKQQATGKSIKGMQAASGAMEQLGVQLDKDFGISKGGTAPTSVDSRGVNFRPRLRRVCGAVRTLSG